MVLDPEEMGYKQLPTKYLILEKSDGEKRVLYSDYGLEQKEEKNLDIEAILNELKELGVRVCPLEELPRLDEIEGRDAEKQIIESMKKGASWLKNVRKSALFYGPPGTGKTHFIRAASRHLLEGKKGYYLEIEGVESPYIGETEQRFSKITEHVKNLRKAGYDVAIMMDEVDRLAPSRSNMGGGGKRDTTTAALRFTEEAIKSGAYVFATTNDPRNLDSAFRSRMAQTIYMGTPDAKMFEGVIKKEILNKNIAEDLIRAGLPKKLEAAGADLRNLQSVLGKIALNMDSGMNINEAVDKAIEELKIEKSRSENSFV